MRSLFTAVACLALATSATAADWRDKVIEEIRKEPKVVEAMFPQKISLWISVQDDGTDRSGFADYFCTLLHSAGMEDGDFIVIKIWDAAAMAKDEMVELGRSECSKKG